MNVVSERKEIIFKNIITFEENGEKKERPIYKIGLSHKNIDGSYSNGSMLCKFSKNAPIIETKALIYIKNAWIDFYFKERKKETGEKFKETIPYIFINEFETLDETIENSKNDSLIQNEVDPYQQFNEEMALSDDDLPF